MAGPSSLAPSSRARLAVAAMLLLGSAVLVVIAVDRFRTPPSPGPALAPGDGEAPASDTPPRTPPRFHARLDFEVAGNAEWIAAADLNGNGIVDLAVATDVGGTVDLLFGNGDGSFREVAPLSVGSRVRAVAPADLDGDGIVDLAVTSMGDGDLHALRGRGDGTFEEMWSAHVFPDLDAYLFDDMRRLDLGIDTLHDLGGVTAGDLNGDGRDDLVLIRALICRTPTVRARPGPGSAERPERSLPDDEARLAVSRGDYDGLSLCSRLDPARWGGRSIAVILSEPGGGHGAPIPIQTGPGPLSVAIAQLTGDPAPDLVVAQAHADELLILEGDGMGGFSPSDRIATGRDPVSVVAEDLDLDGDVDLAVANRGSDDVHVLLRGVDGAFTRAVLQAGPVPDFLAAADMDGDRYPDLVLANGGDPAVVGIYFSRGDGSFLPTDTSSRSAAPI